MMKERGSPSPKPPRGKVHKKIPCIPGSSPASAFSVANSASFGGIFHLCLEYSRGLHTNHQ